MNTQHFPSEHLARLKDFLAETCNYHGRTPYEVFCDEFRMYSLEFGHMIEGDDEMRSLMEEAGINIHHGKRGEYVNIQIQGEASPDLIECFRDRYHRQANSKRSCPWMH